ncbi:MAG: hypothetical protein ISS31_09105 [Kiritimatiellae bacterium]|nr:hypothetical protein [Kiritimatiellia bacterium]
MPGQRPHGWAAVHSEGNYARRDVCGRLDRDRTLRNDSAPGGGGNFPWEKDEGTVQLHCPDPKGITFLLERVD